MEFYFTFVQQAQMHAATSGLHWRRSKGLTPTWLLPLYSLFSFFPATGWREQGSGPTPVQHQGRRRSVRRAECVRSLLGQGCARQASFLTGHTQCPRHKKVSDDTTSETHTCTKHNTDTSGNSESVRAPRTARSTTRACSHTSLCRSCLSNAHHLPPRPPSLW